MSLSTFSSDFTDTALLQLGASKIKVVSGKQHVVDFDLEGAGKLTYVFTITNEHRYYLQRVRPYPMVQGRFAGVEEIVSFIARDARAFQAARQSKNYQNFVDSTRDALALAGDLEQLFLAHNVSPKDLSALREEFSRLRALIHSMGDASPAVKAPAAFESDR